jgi:DNA-binding CsgD family transcriptional regulator
VLRDTEMLPRPELEANRLYRHCHEIGVPLEHVMSIMLDFGSDWHAGITLYRGRRHGFSDRDRHLLQQLAPSLGNTVRSCKLLSEAQRRSALLDAILEQEGLDAIILSPRLVEIARTGGLGPLLTKWFARTECDRTGLPHELVEKLRRLIRERKTDALAASSSEWRMDRHGTSLRVTFVPLPEAARTAGWALVFQEVHPIPKSWERALTPTQREVAKWILAGWDNHLIAEEVGCEPTTVKKHVQHIFDRLGVSSRAALCHLAAQQR